MNLDKFSWPTKNENPLCFKHLDFNAAGLEFYTNGRYTCVLDNFRAVFGIIENGNNYEIVPIIDNVVFETLQMDVVKPEVHPFDDSENLLKFMQKLEVSLQSIGCRTHSLNIAKTECSIHADSMEYWYPKDSHPSFDILYTSATMDLITARWVQAFERGEIVGPYKYSIKESGYNIDMKHFILKLNKLEATIHLDRTKDCKNPFWNIGDNEINIRYIHAALAYIVSLHPELPTSRGENKHVTFTSLTVPTL